MIGWEWKHREMWSGPVLIARKLDEKMPSTLAIIYFVDSQGGEGTPDPIPNSEVKLSIADDTA